ncbi:AraC family transcriptional regulator [Chryseobacterium populi]|uniref:DNA-binding domain-containing protein, AraC-type n=1 Tax=Chryseobacterium populi TaxID=1144316 RepID=J2TC87_9FLAO|nr:AraC family transcriptional regulator [Chryseobacterium populi]EJL75797.1 DNA-binding domain-containing protein, AraC-type [Chryseobacterium populi]
MTERIYNAIKKFPQEKILKDNGVLLAKWKINSASAREFVLIQENTFVFVLKGHKIIVKDDDEITVGNKQLLVLKKGVHKMTEYLAADGQFEALVIYFDDSFIKYLSDFNKADWTQPSLKADDILLLDSNKVIDGFVEQYLNYIQENINDSVVLKLKVAELIYLLLKEHPYVKSFFVSVIQQHSHLKSMMEKLYKEDYTVSQLADFSNRSLSVFKRDFTKIFNCSPGKWILSRKLSDACFYLINTDKNISEIAYECGFGSLSRFDKSFKKEFNMTPSSFRSAGMGQISK